MARIVDGERELIGYTSTWSVEPRNEIELMVSATEPEVDVRLVRLRHGDPNPAGPGYLASHVPSLADGTYPGLRQEIQSGSYAIITDPLTARTRGVWAWPTRPAAGQRQVILDAGALSIVLDADGYPGARFDDAIVMADERLKRHRWVMLAAAVDDKRLLFAVGGTVYTTVVSGDFPLGEIHLAVGAGLKDHYDGRLEDAFAFDRALNANELAAVAAGKITPDRVWDLREAHLRNAPTTAVTGRHWDDDATDFRAVPEGYAAVHFHSDDLEDAEWAPMLRFSVPEDLRSGIYAFELRTRDLADHVPFVVRRARTTPANSIGLLLPTLTYQAYGNERLIAGTGEGGMAPTPSKPPLLDPADEWLARHPEAGSSCYDFHADGHGISLVSHRRPIPNFRPSFSWWITRSPERFGADLYLLDWLEHLDCAYDVFTDHDLDAVGQQLLDAHRVILTGTHPEYVTGRMLDALRSYLEGGGRLMYLGGNGFYWVTSIDPHRPHLAEVRRGLNGTRAWTSQPGELRHQTTGEQGGLWRYRGRDPNRLVGVGFAAQSDNDDRAPGYRRTEASHREQFSWIFEGVTGDLIGEHGLYLGGAAGYEIDRYDTRHGSPEEAVVLATSQGMNPDSYLLVIEDMLVTIPEIAASHSDRVRADMTYVPYPNGGAVFSVGSCSWCGSLGTNRYDNDVARITENVLRRFLEGDSGRA